MMKPNGTKTKKVMLIEFKVLWLYFCHMAWQTKSDFKHSNVGQSVWCAGGQSF